jgi:uncharacterized protein (TIGR04376 family)
MAMGLFDDMKRFLETQLDDFMSKNPHLQIQVLEEQLQQQETDTLTLLVELRQQEKQIQSEVLTTAQEIKGWHGRVAKAQNAGKTDLAAAAQERMDSLLRQGNQLWGKMQGVKERTAQANQLVETIKVRRLELKKKAAEMKTTQASNPVWETPSRPWTNETTRPDRSDPLDAEFLRWETEEELARLKKNLGK